MQKLEPDASNANQQVSHELEEAIRMSVAEAHAQASRSPAAQRGAHGATRETAGTCPKARVVCVSFGRISAKQTHKEE